MPAGRTGGVAGGDGKRVLHGDAVGDGRIKGDGDGLADADDVTADGLTVAWSTWAAGSVWTVRVDRTVPPGPVADAASVNVPPGGRVRETAPSVGRRLPDWSLTSRAFTVPALAEAFTTVPGASCASSAADQVTCGAGVDADAGGAAPERPPEPAPQPASSTKAAMPASTEERRMVSYRPTVRSLSL